MSPPLVVLDTNIIISAVMFGGVPRQLLESVLQGHLRMALSRPLLDECLTVLEGPKFKVPPHITQLIADELVAIATIVRPHKRLSVIRRDPADNRVLECAVAAGAEYIISGDDDLLNIRKYKAIAIMKPRQFLDHIRDEQQ